MEDRRMVETVTVVGSGGSFAAGATTSLLTVAQTAGVLVSNTVLSATGVGAFVVGAVGAYLLRDKILRRAERDARSLEEQKPATPYTRTANG